MDTTKLREEIDEKLDKLKDMDPSTKEYSTAVEGVTKLMDRIIEIEKLDTSVTHNENQMKEDRKARWIKNLIDIGAIVLPLGVTIWGAKTSLKFEETGTVTTGVGRKFIDRLFNFKK